LEGPAAAAAAAPWLLLLLLLETMVVEGCVSKLAAAAMVEYMLKKVKKDQNMAPGVRLQTESSTFFHRLS